MIRINNPDREPGENERFAKAAERGKVALGVVPALAGAGALIKKYGPQLVKLAGKMAGSISKKL